MFRRWILKRVNEENLVQYIVQMNSWNFSPICITVLSTFHLEIDRDCLLSSCFSFIWYYSLPTYNLFLLMPSFLIHSFVRKIMFHDVLRSFEKLHSEDVKKKKDLFAFLFGTHSIHEWTMIIIIISSRKIEAHFDLTFDIHPVSWHLPFGFIS